MPDPADIRSLMAEAQRMHGCFFEQPWEIAGHPTVFVLTVIQEMGADKPIWTLYDGEGAGSKVVWSAADSDLDLITDIIYMFMTPPPAPPEVATPPEPEPAETAAEAVSDGFFQTLTPVDYQMLKQQPNILLGHLLTESGLLPEPTLDAALKLQEMVRNDSLSPAQAIDALRKAHARGIAVSEAAATVQSQSRPSSDAKMAIDLLKQAGLITDDEINSVMKITRGKGDLDKVLVAAKKVDAVTMEAAQACWPLIRDGRMKPEQAIIALHFCNRSRVGFAEAIRELGWELS